MKALFLLPFLFLALAVVLLAADRPTNQHSIQRAMRRGKDATSAACCLHCFAVSHRHLLLVPKRLCGRCRVTQRSRIEPGAFELPNSCDGASATGAAIREGDVIRH